MLQTTSVASYIPPLSGDNSKHLHLKCTHTHKINYYFFKPCVVSVLLISVAVKQNTSFPFYEYNQTMCLCCEIKYDISMFSFRLSVAVIACGKQPEN